jgi:hypothetical protein
MQVTTINSSSERSGLTLTLDPLENFVFSGVQQKFAQKFGCPVVWSTSTDAIQQVAKVQGGRNQVSYPYIILSMDAYTISSTRGNIKNQALRGSQSVVVTDEKRTYNVHYIPVDFDVSVELRANSFSQVSTFANRWMFSRVLGWLKFDIQYGTHHFGISVEPTDSVTIPKRDAEPGTVQEYIINTTAKVLGFISMPELLEQQIVDNLVITGQLNETDPATGDNRVIYTTSSKQPVTSNSIKPYPPNLR